MQPVVQPAVQPVVQRVASCIRSLTKLCWETHRNHASYLVYKKYIFLKILGIPLPTGEMETQSHVSHPILHPVVVAAFSPLFKAAASGCCQCSAVFERFSSSFRWWLFFNNSPGGDVVQYLYSTVSAFIYHTARISFVADVQCGSRLTRLQLNSFV